MASLSERAYCCRQVITFFNSPTEQYQDPDLRGAGQFVIRCSLLADSPFRLILLVGKTHCYTDEKFLKTSAATVTTSGKSY